MPVEFTPSEAAALLKSATQERLAKFEQEVAELRAIELKKALIPPHKHVAGVGAGPGTEDVPPRLGKAESVCKSCGKSHTAKSCTPEPLMKPAVSEAQRRAMGAAAKGKSKLGIPKSVGEDFIEADKGGKLPAKKSEPPMAKPPSGKASTPAGNSVPTSKMEVQKSDPGSFAHQAQQHMLSDASRAALAPTPEPKLPSPQENEARAASYADAMPQPQPKVQSPVMKRRAVAVSVGPIQSAARPAVAKPGIFGRISQMVGR